MHTQHTAYIRSLVRYFFCLFLTCPHRPVRLSQPPPYLEHDGWGTYMFQRGSFTLILSLTKYLIIHDREDYTIFLFYIIDFSIGLLAEAGCFNYLSFAFSKPCNHKCILLFVSLFTCLHTVLLLTPYVIRIL